MRILFCGDIVGRSGREVVIKYVPELRKNLNLDFVVVNVENAAAGFGTTKKICDELFSAGVDVLTGGNHSFDNKDILPWMGKLTNVLRPLNYPPGTPGNGIVTVTSQRGKKLTVINVMCRLFMDPLDDPFKALASALNEYKLGANTDAILIDCHGEATSEKRAMAWTADGNASVFVGTHTHVPTADHMIMPQGMAYQTDTGMCGDYNSVIGMKAEIPIAKFIRKIPTDRMSPAEGEATLCGLFVETDDSTGKAVDVRPIRMGGILSPSL